MPVDAGLINAQIPLSVKNYQPDVAGSIEKGYSLADSIGQSKENTQLRQQRATDQDVIKNYQGDIHTPDGLEKALSDPEFKKSLSPDAYMNFVNQNQKMKEFQSNIRLKAQESDINTLHLWDAQQEQEMKAMAGSLDTYDKDKSSKGEPAALANFDLSKKQIIQELSSQKNPQNGSPLYPPEQLKSFESMSPDQLRGKLKFSAANMKIIDAELERRNKEKHIELMDSEKNLADRSTGRNLDPVAKINEEVRMKILTPEQGQSQINQINSMGAAKLNNLESLVKERHDKNQSTIDLLNNKDAIDLAAQEYVKTKQMPNLGMGGSVAPLRMKILQRASDIYKKETGQDISTLPEYQANFKANQGEISKSLKDFGTGQQGNQVRSFNVSLSHLDTLKQLASALNNGDTKLINKYSNAWKEQTGEAAPSNFEAASGIISSEIVKAVVAGGGAFGDREDTKKQLQNYKSPQQILGAIDTYQNLLKGQLGGLRKQYEDSTGRNDFDKKLSARSKELLKSDEGNNSIIVPSLDGTIPATKPPMIGLDTPPRVTNRQKAINQQNSQPQKSYKHLW